MTNFIATIQSQSAIESAWSQALDLWNSPEAQPVIIGALIISVILGFMLTPLRRSFWLAIKPRNISKTNRG